MTALTSNLIDKLNENIGDLNIVLYINGELKTSLNFHPDVIIIEGSEITISDLEDNQYFLDIDNLSSYNKEFDSYDFVNGNIVESLSFI